MEGNNRYDNWDTSKQEFIYRNRHRKWILHDKKQKLKNLINRMYLYLILYGLHR